MANRSEDVPSISREDRNTRSPGSRDPGARRSATNTTAPGSPSREPRAASRADVSGYRAKVADKTASTSGRKAPLRLSVDRRSRTPAARTQGDIGICPCPEMEARRLAATACTPRGDHVARGGCSWDEPSTSGPRQWATTILSTRIYYSITFYNTSIRLSSAELQHLPLGERPIVADGSPVSHG